MTLLEEEITSNKNDENDSDLITKIKNKTMPLTFDYFRNRTTIKKIRVWKYKLIIWTLSLLLIAGLLYAAHIWLVNQILEINGVKIQTVAHKERNSLAVKLETYLRGKNSPLADVSDLLVEQDDWRRIVALANAESSLCRNYPVDTANCWGVGGSPLWDFGNNLKDGVLAMQRFLDQYPKKSNKKYTDWTYKEMNGVYKQPAANHWLVNIYTVEEELTKYVTNEVATN